MSSPLKRDSRSSHLPALLGLRATKITFAACDYSAEAFVGDRVRGFVAEVEGTIVGAVTLLIAEHAPRKHEPERRGWVTDMFVIEAARRRGHARALMHALTAHARAHGIRRLVLRSSDDALSLYGSMGFEPFDTFALLLL